MNKQQQIIGTITSTGLLPLFFHPSPEVSTAVLKALYDAGVRAVEYTNRGAEALDNFTRLKKISATEFPGMYLGIGTIKHAASAKAFIAAGADFIISPGISEEVIGVAKAHDLLWMPGCMTPTEIMYAERLDAKVVKLFPGNMLGPAFVSAIRELFPNVLFMPTGGVDTTEENLREWFSSGVAAVGMGSKLLTPAILRDKSYAAITAAASKIIERIASVRNK